MARLRGWLPGLIAFGLWLGSTPLGAQQVPIGSELRLWRCPTIPGPGARCGSEYHAVRGRFSRVAGDSLYLTDPPLAVPLGAVGRVDLAIGRRSHTLLGAAIGGAVGAVAGGLATSGLCAREECGVTVAPLVFVGGGLVGGAILGGVVGAVWRSTRWRPVSVAGFRVALSIRTEGAARAL
ncbi:MAG: hypothetical protein R2909_04035 [Gemmatimonadales bacterium]